MAKRLDHNELECAVTLLFEVGDRPNSRAIGNYARTGGHFSISIDPGDDGSGSSWVELLANGLTFDLVGLSPGRGVDSPEREHLFGLPANFDSSGLEAITITPGPHLMSGGAMVPVVRCLAWLAAQLCEMGGVKAVVWNSARSCCSPQYFNDSVMRWISGGVFPGLGLTALLPMADGAMQSEGLALFTGQELQLEAQIARDRSEAAKVALRLLHWLVENGRVDQSISLTGPSGEPLFLEPIHELGIVKARKGSR